MFEVNGWHKFGEEDIYEDGCQPETGFSFGGRERFSAETVDKLIEHLTDFVCVRTEDHTIEFDACEEEGRVDIYVMETSSGMVASEYEIEKWKTGEQKLFNVVYTFYVEEVERKPYKFGESFKEADDLANFLDTSKNEREHNEYE